MDNSPTTLRDLVDAVDALRKLGEQKIKNGKVLYAITYNIRQADNHTRDYTKARDSLIENYATWEEKEGRWKFHDQRGFNREIDKILDTPIDPGEFRRLEYNQLKESAEITPIILAQLWWMLDGELPEE